VATTMSADMENPPETLAMLGASFALELAGLPFNGPIGAVRVGRVDGKFVGNPTYEQLENSDMDLIVAGTESSIMMVEAGCDFVTERDILSAIDYAHQIIKKQVEAQRDFVKAFYRLIERHCRVKNYGSAESFHGFSHRQKSTSGLH